MTPIDHAAATAMQSIFKDTENDLPRLNEMSAAVNELLATHRPTCGEAYRVAAYLAAQAAMTFEPGEVEQLGPEGVNAILHVRARAVALMVLEYGYGLYRERTGREPTAEGPLQ